MVYVEHDPARVVELGLRCPRGEVGKNKAGRQGPSLIRNVNQISVLQTKSSPRESSGKVEILQVSGVKGPVHAASMNYQQTIDSA